MIISRRFSVFIAVGISCALIDVGLMQLLIWFGVNYLYAATMGFFLGLMINFLLHTHVTFSATYSHTILVRFAGVVLLNYFVTLLIIYLFQAFLGLPLLGKSISLLFVAINGYLLSKNWVYK